MSKHNKNHEEKNKSEVEQTSPNVNEVNKEQEKKNVEEKELTDNKKEPEVKPKSEIEILLDQIKSLNDTISAKEKRIQSLEAQIEVINKDYVIKVTQKANEANELLKQKSLELDNKFKTQLEEAKKYAIEKKGLELVDIINQYEIALSFTPKDPAILNYQNGFKMFLTMFKNLLDDLGIHEINVKVGDDFDPLTMEIIESVHSNEYKENQVIQIINKGYKLHERLLKPVAVKIAKKLS